MNPRPLGWPGIVRLGLVQASIGGVVVLATSTLNRVMVVEWALPAFVPGLLVALHYLIQVLRPRFGFGADRGGRATPWIAGGMAMLAAGGIAAAAATASMGAHPWAGIALAVIAYAAIGLGVGAAGTALLVLLAARCAPQRRAAAATIVWTMMIAGFGITATFAGRLLDPFSPARLAAVVSGVCAAALAVSLLAVAGVEGKAAAAAAAAPPRQSGFMAALREVWAEPQARRFALFVFVSMLAYSAQELVLEPFAGLVFALSPGQSAQLTGVQHGGALAGMLLVAAAGTAFAGRPLGSMRLWTIAGCAGSGMALLALAAGGAYGPGWPLRGTVAVLGMANGAFAVAAVSAMMGFAHSGGARRAGTRMGLFGAAQAVAFALGGLAGTLGSDAGRTITGSAPAAYAAVFAAQALLFLIAAGQAASVFRGARGPAPAGALAEPG